MANENSRQNSLSPTTAAIAAHRHQLGELLARRTKSFVSAIDDTTLERVFRMEQANPGCTDDALEAAIRAAFSTLGALSDNGQRADADRSEPHAGWGEPIGPDAPEVPLRDGLPTDSARQRSVTDDLVSSTEFTRLLGLNSPETVRNHIKSGDLIGWRLGKRNFVLPRSQLDSANRYIPYLGRINAYFSEPSITWAWLNRPNRNTAGTRPLERLRSGHDKEVERAAAMYRDGAFT